MFQKLFEEKNELFNETLNTLNGTLQAAIKFRASNIIYPILVNKAYNHRKI